MKRLMLILVLILWYTFPVPAFAASLEWKVIMHYPEAYTLLVFTGADPAKPLPRDTIIKVVDRLYAKEPVNTVQIAVYDAGKKLGDGLRAYGKKHRPPTPLKNELLEVTSKEDAIYRELWCGYPTTPAGLGFSYASNEVVADEVYTGNPVIIESRSTPGVRKNENGQPYMLFPRDAPDEYPVLLLLNINDPGLRKVGFTSKIAVRGYPRGVENGQVVVDNCTIIIPPEK